MGTEPTPPMSRTVARTIAAVMVIGALSVIAYFVMNIWQAAWVGTLCLSFIFGIAFSDHCTFKARRKS